MRRWRLCFPSVPHTRWSAAARRPRTPSRTPSSLRPDLVLSDATLGLGGRPNLVTRMLEVCP